RCSSAISARSIRATARAAAGSFRGSRAEPRAGTPRVARVPRLGYAAPVRLAYHMMSAPSPIGLLFLARTAKGLRYLEFMNRRSLKRMIAAHADALPDATWEPSLLELKSITEQLESYFLGTLREFEVPLDPV